MGKVTSYELRYLMLIRPFISSVKPTKHQACKRRGATKLDQFQTVTAASVPSLIGYSDKYEIAIIALIVFFIAICFRNISQGHLRG